MLKFKKILLITSALMLLAFPAFAYDGKTEDIVVNGTANGEYQPDTAYVNFSILGYGKTPDEAATMANLKNQALEKSLHQQAKTLGKLDQNNYSLRPVYNEKGNIDKYEAVKVIKFTVDDPAKAGLLVNLLLAADVDKINSIDFVVENHRELARELLKEAVRDAQTRGEIAATTANRQLGRLLHMTVYNYPAMNSKRFYSREMASNEAVIEPTNVKIDVQVEAIFALQ